MGYEEDRFIDQEQVQQFKCVVCQDILENPLTCSICEGVFCSQCLHKYQMIQPQQCPKSRCRNANFSRMHVLLRNIYLSMKIKCKFHKNGCEHIESLEKISDHESKCTCVLKLCAVCEMEYKLSDNHDCIQSLKAANKYLSEQLVLKGNEFEQTINRKAEIYEKSKKETQQLYQRTLEQKNEEIQALNNIIINKDNIIQNLRYQLYEIQPQIQEQPNQEQEVEQGQNSEQQEANIIAQRTKIIKSKIKDLKGNFQSRIRSASQQFTQKAIIQQINNTLSENAKLNQNQNNSSQSIIYKVTQLEQILDAHYYTNQIIKAQLILQNSGSKTWPTNTILRSIEIDCLDVQIGSLKAGQCTLVQIEFKAPNIAGTYYYRFKVFIGSKNIEGNVVIKFTVINKHIAQLIS